jgi:hypothetical protein
MRLILFVAAVSALAQSYTPPESIAHRAAIIVSEGTRMHAEVFALKQSAGKKLPTILMAHGWGGTVTALRPDAVKFAEAGYLAVAFDYRGWGLSDSRVILAQPAPKQKTNHRFTAEVIEVREVVDPLDQTRDWLNALHWLQGEEQCDTSRIGIWGSSYSGGHVVWVAARDARVKAVVSQVGSFDSRWVVADDAQRAVTEREATERARGEKGYPPPSARVIGNLRGAPIRDKMIHYAPVEDVPRTRAAILFIIAAEEELFDNRDHGIKAHARANEPKKLVSIPGIKHYGIYNEARAQAQQLAVGWFDAHLKSPH